MKQWILLLCICLPLTVAAKHSKEYYDIMKQVYSIHNDTEKVTMLLNLANTPMKEQHWKHDRFTYAELALDIADSLQYKKGIGDAYIMLGRFTARRHRSSSLRYFSDALRVRTDLKDTTAIGHALYYMGTAYIRKRQYGTAQKALTQAKQLLEHSDDRSSLANTIGTLGWTDGRCHNYTAAKLNLGTSISMFEQLGNKRAEGQNFVHLAYVCKRDGSYADAIKHAKKGKELALEVKDKKTVMRANHCLKHVPKQYRHAA